MALDWDILNDACSSTSGWTVNTGAVTAVTFESKSCLKFESDGTVASSNWLWHTPDVYPASNFTLECGIHLAATGTITTVPNASISVNVNSGASPYHRYVVLIQPQSSTKEGRVGIYTDSINTYYYANIGDIDSEWLDVRLVVTTGRKASVWVNDRCILSDIAVTYTSTGARDIYFGSGGSITTTAGLTTHLDYYRCDSTPEVQTTVSPLKIGDQEISVRPNQDEASTSRYEQGEQLKVYGKNTATGSNEVLEVPLVATSDTYASKARIYDGSAVKSLMKLPT